MPKGVYARPSIMDRLMKWSVEDPETHCRVWMGTRTRDGYGQIGVWDSATRRQHNTHAHRVMFELAHGPLPPGIFACHHCDNPPCINLEHLFAGTVKDNVADMIRKGRARRVNGEDHGLAKFSAEFILAVRAALAETGGKQQYEIAARFGLAQSHVSRIWNGHTWRHMLNGG